MFSLFESIPKLRKRSHCSISIKANNVLFFLTKIRKIF